MSDQHAPPRLETGVPNLDALLGGGLLPGTSVVIAGAPGSGKTALALQIAFHHASTNDRAIVFNTQSEPTARTLRFQGQFDFFDTKKLGNGIQFVDLGGILRSDGLDGAFAYIMAQVKQIRPSVIVIDTFRVFDDLAESSAELRRFTYELTVGLMAFEATSLLLGEFGPEDLDRNALFTITDGLILLSQREEITAQHRFLRIIKMRGTAHSRDEHSFQITSSGLSVYAPRISLVREPAADASIVSRLSTHVSKLDTLVGNGIPRGSSLLVSGVAGTGKTLLCLEFVYRGALIGEKGIFISFEETEERLRAAASGLGWELDHQIDAGMVEILFIPQPDVQLDLHLEVVAKRVERLQAKRVCIDSVSVFMNKVTDARAARENMFHLATIVQNAQAVGLFATDIPYGSHQLSRFGVEETVVDGVILLTASQVSLERERYIEIYKLRNTAHLRGRHSLVIGEHGLEIYPRYDVDFAFSQPLPPFAPGQRLPSGVPGLDPLIGGGLLERSVTVLSGSTGIGKSTLAMQFILHGCERGERGLYLTLDQGQEQLVYTAEALGLPLQAALDNGLATIRYLARERTRASQLLAVISDYVEALRPRRIVIDSTHQLENEGLAESDLRQLMFTLLHRFKLAGATTLLTRESPCMYSTETATDGTFSQLADNLIVVRYVARQGRIDPTLLVVKSRGSARDCHTHPLSVGQGGVRIGTAQASTAAGGGDEDVG